MLKEMAPRLRRVALIGNPKTGPYEFFLPATQAAATPLGLQVVANRVENEADLESSLQAFSRETDGGLVVIPDATMTRLRSKVIELAARTAAARARAQGD
jgi:ABC-type uncharacterized transport system substrate-binding protein